MGHLAQCQSAGSTFPTVPPLSQHRRGRGRPKGVWVHAYRGSRCSDQGERCFDERTRPRRERVWRNQRILVHHWTWPGSLLEPPSSHELVPSRLGPALRKCRRQGVGFSVALSHLRPPPTLWPGVSLTSPQQPFRASQTQTRTTMAAADHNIQGRLGMGSQHCDWRLYLSTDLVY